MWKNIPGWKNYQASKFGEIKSNFTGKIMSCCKNRPDDKGYLQVSVISDNGKRLTRKVHTLVCLAFHGNYPSLSHTVNHKDGNRLNNAAFNLEWMTRQEQAIHSYHALNNIAKRPRGKDNHWRANYSDDEVRKIRQLHKSGLGYHRIRSAMGKKTSWVAIQMIVTGKTYSHVTD